MTCNCMGGPNCCRLRTDPALLEALRTARAPTPWETYEQRVGWIAAECNVSKDRVREVLVAGGIHPPGAIS